VTVKRLFDPSCDLTLHRPIWIQDTPQSIGMTVPHSETSFREIAQIVGIKHPITVMDVKHQDELEGWVLQDMVDYFEDEYRKYNSGPIKRKKASTMRVLNQISLEFSFTPFSKVVRSPSFVREIDFIDNVWPKELKASGDYPRVQYYLLTSTRGCYTDFHVDFGGTSVWYHIISGKKVFLLLPPTENNMKLYEDWLCRKDQNDIFFPDYSSNGICTESCVKVTLEQGNTFIIPTGWIHAVYTPVDSLVIGGNFLHGLDLKGQIDVHCIESRTRVPQKFRFPYFKQIMLYAAKEYYRKLKDPNQAKELSKDELKGLPHLVSALRGWIGEHNSEGPDHVGSMSYVESDCLNQLKPYEVIDIDDLLNRIESEICHLTRSDPEWKGNNHAAGDSWGEYKVTNVFSLQKMQEISVACDELNCPLSAFCTWTASEAECENYNYCLDHSWNYFGGSKISSEFSNYFSRNHREFIRNVSTIHRNRANVLRVKDEFIHLSDESQPKQQMLKIKIKRKADDTQMIALNPDSHSSVSDKKSENEDENFPDLSIHVSNEGVRAQPFKRTTDLTSKQGVKDEEEWTPDENYKDTRDFTTNSKRAKSVKTVKMTTKSVSSKPLGSAKARLKKKLGF
jgi:F-box/leucine-rich repeat protein 10/11